MRWNVFAIRVTPYAPHSVERRVAEVHIWVGGLVLVVAPAIQNIFSIAVQIDEKPDIGKIVEDPFRITALGFGECARAVIEVMMTWIGGIHDTRGRAEMGRKIP